MNIRSIRRSTLLTLLTLLVFMSSTGYAGSSENTDKGPAKSIKDQVAVGLDMAAYAKLSVSETFMTDEKWPNNNDEAKVAPVIDTDFTIKVGNNGVVTIIYLVPAELAGKSIVMTPSSVEKGTVNWDCKSPDIAAEYLPKRCR